MIMRTLRAVLLLASAVARQGMFSQVLVSSGPVSLQTRLQTTEPLSIACQAPLVMVQDQDKDLSCRHEMFQKQFNPALTV